MKEISPETIENLPDWLQYIWDAHMGRSSQMFILHGNVNDIISIENEKGVTYSMLPEFLASQVFGTWDIIAYYDQVRGPRALASNKSKLNRINRNIELFLGKAEELKAKRDPVLALGLLDRFLEKILIII